MVDWSAWSSNGFPELKSERLNYRQLTDTYAQDIFEIRSNVSLMHFVPRPPMTHISEVSAFLEMNANLYKFNEGIQWGMILPETDELIGMIGMYRIKPEHNRSEVGYILKGNYHSQGYISEALAVITRWAFESLRFHSLEAVIDPDNAASEKVLLRAQWTKEAHYRENTFWQGKYCDTVVYGLLKSEWQQKIT
jgi:[ribosomal protein S5]-alanine N-acetyltransferase